ncbi:MAG: aminotransferase class V-fold PLP-dependent enzyme [Clostridia bacterium]|nr:aminotransferase class V-fold PLP-dependent enzyme [Clostridia bacterium]
MIYFDNAATGGTKPQNVLTAVHAALQLCANPGRAAHRLAITCLNGVQACRKALAQHFDCPDHDRVIFTKNCTEALNIALQGLIKAGDHVITTCLEHNSVLRPLHHLKQRRGIEYDICPLDGGELAPQRIASFLRPNTRAVVITAASNVSGYCPDLAQIRKLLPEDVLLICDGAQGGGHIPLKMTGAGIDVLCLAGHKGLHGIQGSGVLLLSSRANPDPLLFGGTGSLSFTQDMPDFLPDNLEAGTLNYPAILSLFEGVNYLTVHEQEIAERLKRLTATLIRGLKKLPEVRIYSQPNPCGIVSFAHRKHPSEYLSMLLSQKYDIATRGGLHCAPLMHEALGTSGDGLLRVSFGHQNTEREVETLLSALQAVCED